MLSRLTRPGRAMARPILLALLAAAMALGAGGTAAAQPGQIVDGIAPVGPGNTVRDRATGIFAVTLQPDPARSRRPVLRQNVEGPEAEFLRARAARGYAAGMAGFLYDNRDRGHSNMKLHRFPQLAATHYAPVFRAEGLDYGIAGAFRFPVPVIGNSSTAITKGPFRRSQARVAAADQAAAARAFALYAANHLYVYPEHRDHDPGRGDLFFANAPFLLVSQGSSGSDQPLLRAMAMTLAALRADTFAALAEAGLVAPTLQMLIRRNRPAAMAGDGYLSGAAHPTVFSGDSLDVPGMMRAANALEPDAIPPMVRLRVVEDFAAVAGLDHLDPSRSETIFTTPVAIARAWRSLDREREIVLDAADTEDPNGRALSFDWVILRGDPARISIRHDPDDAARTRARIRIAWHDAYPVPGDPGMTTSRVDIGVFASNGATVSAPSILSVVFPTHQDRRYAPGPDGAMRLAEISYRLPPRGGPDVDPWLWAVADWTDSYSHDDRGARVTRRYGDGDGTRRLRLTGGVLVTDPADGAPMPVTHRPTRAGDGRPVLSDGLRDGLGARAAPPGPGRPEAPEPRPR